MLGNVLLAAGALLFFMMCLSGALAMVLVEIDRWMKDDIEDEIEDFIEDIEELLKEASRQW